MGFYPPSLSILWHLLIECPWFGRFLSDPEVREESCLGERSAGLASTAKDGPPLPGALPVSLVLP